MTGAVNLELPLRHRGEKQQQEKRRIALQAARLVPDGAVVGLTGGTTTSELARVLAERLTAQEGCTTHDEMEAQTDRAFLRSSARAVVLADSTKIGRVRFAKICALSEVHDLVTDDALTKEQEKGIADCGVRVHRARPSRCAEGRPTACVVTTTRPRSDQLPTRRRPRGARPGFDCRHR